MATKNKWGILTQIGRTQPKDLATEIEQKPWKIWMEGWVQTLSER